jgi:hypothetical protein
MALSKERLTPRIGDAVITSRLDLPVKANTKILAGALVVIDAGYAAPGRTATGLKAVGVAQETVDNTGGVAGAMRVDVRRGAFKRFKNSAAGDAIARADVYGDCYIVDDETVAKTDDTGARSKAGRILDVDATGVTVEFI